MLVIFLLNLSTFFSSIVLCFMHVYNFKDSLPPSHFIPLVHDYFMSFFALFSFLLAEFTLCLISVLHVFHRVEAVGYQRVLQVDLEVNGLMVTQGSREVAWQVEYPLTRTVTSEVQTLIRLAPQDLGGIVPLAMVRKK